jgi:AraC-like DNA-binding protein
MMSAHHNTSATVSAVLAVCEELGVKPAELLRAASISPDIVGNPDGEVTLEQMRRFWQSAYAMSQDPLLAMHAGQNVASGAYKCIDYLWTSAETLGAGLIKVCEYFRLINTWLAFEIVEQRRGKTIVAHSRVGPLPRPPIEFMWTVLTRRIRQNIGDQWAPLRLSFTGPAPSDPRQYEYYFRCPVEFGAAEAEFVLSNEAWSTPLQHADDALFALLDDHARHLMQMRPDPSDVVELTRNEIFRALHGGVTERDAIALRMGMSARTLQRRLSSAGVSFGHLLRDVRQDLARHHLARNDMALSEIAFLLGFSDQSAFTRAFKRWTDQTPRTFRQEKCRSGIETA